MHRARVSISLQAMAKSSFPISWNIDGQDLRPWLRDNNYAGLKAHLLKLNPAAILIMDSLPIAVMVKEWLPDCIVIHRNYSSYEGSEWQTRPPHVMVNQWKREGHKNIVRYLTNEPSFNAASAKTFAGREAETMKLAREAGFTVVALNTSVGSYERVFVQDGKFDAILRSAIDYGHYLGCHEYMAVCLPAALIGDDKLGDKVAMQPSNWPREKITAGYHDYWYLFRHVWLVERCKQLGIGIPKFILTEFGYDDIRNDGNAAVFDKLKAEYGIERYNRDMRGVNTYQRVWNDYYQIVQNNTIVPQDHNEVIRQQLQWWLDVKPDWIVGACLFGINADWENPQGHDWSADVRRSFFPVLEEMSRAMAETPAARPPTLDGVTWKQGRVKRNGAGYTNFRSAPSRSGTDLGDIRDWANYAVAYLDFEKQELWTHKGNSYTWVALTRADDQIGYAVVNFIIIDVPDEPPTPSPAPEPPIEPPPAPLPFDEMAIEAIVDRRVDLRIENLRAHIETGHIPRPFAKTISRTLRVIADMLDAAIALEEAQEPQVTTAQIANDVYGKADEAVMAKQVDVLTDNSATEPPKKVVTAKL